MRYSRVTADVVHMHFNIEKYEAKYSILFIQLTEVKIKQQFEEYNLVKSNKILFFVSTNCTAFGVLTTMSVV